MGASAEGAGAKLAALGTLAAVGAAVGLVAVGVAATKMAGDFQQGVVRLATGAGDVTDNMQKMGQGILKVSTDTGVLTNGANGLNQAMYLIISSGQRGAQALDTLSVAAKGAQIEQANVVDVSNALSTAMTDYGTKQFNATQYMNGFIAAVSSGKISLEDLSQAMSPILPVASAMGISFADISSAMSTMTDAGMSADRAATGLRFLMQSLEVPTTKASDAFKKWGVDTQVLANTMKTSLPDALQMIYDAAKKAGPEGSQPFNKAISDMIGGQRSLQAFLDLTGTHLSAFEANTQKVSTAMGQAAKDVQGWAEVQGNFNVQMDRAHAAIDAMSITLGTHLLPTLTPLVGGFANAIPKVQEFVNLLSGVKIPDITVPSAFRELPGLLANLKGIWDNTAKAIADSPNWQGLAGSIERAGNALVHFGTNASDVARIMSGMQGYKSIWDQLGGALKDTTDIFDQGLTAASGILAFLTNKTFTTKEAMVLLGHDSFNAMLSVADATELASRGISKVTDSVTGATINIGQYMRTGNLAVSTTISMADALQLVGKNSGDILTAADAATLLKLHIGEVLDATTGLKISLADMANKTGAFMDYMTRVTQAWYKALEQGQNISFDQFRANFDKNINQELKATGATAQTTRNHLLAINSTPIAPKVNSAQVIVAGTTADQTRAKLLHLNDQTSPKVNTGQVIAAGNTADQTRARLLHLNDTTTPKVNTGNVIAAGNTADQTRARLLRINGPYAPVVNNGSTIAAGNTADQTRAKLLNMNGPYHPNVDASSVAGAGYTADSTRNKLLALNGSSRWNAYVNTYQNTYIATIGGPGSGPGNARAEGGLITEPVVGFGLRTGQRWSFGENGTEMVTPLSGVSGAGARSSGGGRQDIHVHVYLDKTRLSKELMGPIVQQIRTATGVKF